jgi:hypothetical protein
VTALIEVLVVNIRVVNIRAEKAETAVLVGMAHVEMDRDVTDLAEMAHVETDLAETVHAETIKIETLAIRALRVEDHKALRAGIIVHHVVMAIVIAVVTVIETETVMLIAINSVAIIAVQEKNSEETAIATNNKVSGQTESKRKGVTVENNITPRTARTKDHLKLHQNQSEQKSVGSSKNYSVANKKSDKKSV